MVHKVDVDNKKYFDKVDKCACETMSFDEIAQLAIYVGADVMYEDKAKESFETFKTKCSHINDVKDLDFKEDWNEVDWFGVYKQKFAEILDEYGLEPYVDEYGTFGYIDKRGKHFGDAPGQFPWYSNEKLLKESLKGL